MMIELQQKVIVNRQEYGEWVNHAEYEPVYLDPNRIESMILVGITRIRMISGDVIEVKETPLEIQKIAYGPQIIIPSIQVLEGLKS